MWSLEMGKAVRLHGTETDATVIGIAEYLHGETMYLVEYQGDLGAKTSQWRTISEIEPVPEA